MNPEDFKTELKQDEREKNKTKCFKCERVFYKDELIILEFDAEVSEFQNVPDHEPEDTLEMPLCPECQDHLLIINKFETCGNCGDYSKNIESVCIDKGCQYMANGDPGYPAEYENYCSSCRGD